jgi:hypothetical protein
MFEHLTKTVADDKGETHAGVSDGTPKMTELYSIQKLKYGDRY